MKTNPQLAADLIYTQQFIPSTTLVREVVDLFRSYDGNYLAVTEDHAIAGLIGKEKLLTKIAAQYGWALFAEKPIATIMNREPLIFDGQASTMDVLRWVVARPIETVYDDVVISSNGIFAGLISVKLLMIAQLENIEGQLKTVEQQRSILEKTIATHLLDQNVDEHVMARKVDAIVDTAHEMERTEQGSSHQPLHGHLEAFSAIDLVQLLVQGSKTGYLELRAGAAEDSQRFEIHVQNGRIIHAAGAGDTGTEALWKALRLHHGEFTFHFGRTSRETTIQGNSMGLLLEACRRQDETAAVLA